MEKSHAYNLIRSRRRTVSVEITEDAEVVVRAPNRMSISDFCTAAGFVRSTFDRKMNGESEFNRNEIERIINVLHLTDDETRSIFFENVVA